MGSVRRHPRRTNAAILSRFSTRNVDEAVEYLGTLFGSEGRWETSSRQESFVADFETAALGRGTMSRVKLAGYGVSRMPSDIIQVIVPTENILQRVAGTEGLSFSPQSKTAAVSRPGERVSYFVEAGSAIILSVGVGDIIDRAQLLIGEDFADRLVGTMLNTIALDSPIGAVFARKVKEIMGEFKQLDSVGVSALLRSSYDELLLNFVCALIFPEISKAVVKPQLACAPAVVRRARDYIVANAAEPIDIARLARDLGVNMRTLQQNFKLYYSISPREYVIECRLERARIALLNPATEGVTQAALASGFSDLSYFASKYLDKYGELPSRTLRNLKER